MNSRKAVLLLAASLLAGCPHDINHNPGVIAVTSLVSMGAGGVEGNGASTAPSVTPDGRYLAFASASTNLTAQGSGGHVQVYRRDLVTGTILLVSADPAGLPGNGDSDSPSISADGLRVAFRSFATTFSANARGTVADIYVRDLSVSPSATTLLTGARGGGPNDSTLGSFGPSIAQNGAFVAFVSDADDLLTPALPLNGPLHAYRFDLAGGTAALVDLKADGTPSSTGTVVQGVSISADGLTVAFDSDATDLGAPILLNPYSNVYLRDMTKTSGAVLLASPSLDPTVISFGMSSFLPSLSADGKVVAFISTVPNLVPDDVNGAVKDAFVRDLRDPLSPRTILVSRPAPGVGANLPTTSVTVAPDGRSVAFTSQASNLVPQDFNNVADAFWFEIGSGKLVRVSVDTGQREAQGITEDGTALTGNGRFVFFASQASNLVPGVTNGVDNIFMRGPLY